VTYQAAPLWWRPSNVGLYTVDRNGRVQVHVERAELVQDTICNLLFDIELNSIAGWPARLTHNHYMRDALVLLDLFDQSISGLWRAYDAYVQCHPACSLCADWPTEAATAEVLGRPRRSGTALAQWSRAAAPARHPTVGD
jgi:hypothetical protein